jgi:hypothetical protein
LNTRIAILTYPIWFAVSPTSHLYKLLPPHSISNTYFNDNGLRTIVME